MVLFGAVALPGQLSAARAPACMLGRRFAAFRDKWWTIRRLRLTPGLGGGKEQSSEHCDSPIRRGGAYPWPH
jgi:hypothetical protein